MLMEKDITITDERRMPKYRQIESELLTMIKEGQVGVGHQMATELALTGKYGVSRFTARKALDNLEQKGYLVRTAGRGTFVADWRSEQGRSDIGRKDIVALFIDNDTQNLWNMRLLQAMSTAAERSNYHVTFCGVKSHDLNNGSLPLAIREMISQGVLINGECTELQIKKLLEFNLQYLFVGNYATTYGLSAISFDAEDMAFKITSALFTLMRGPVWLIVEPFRMFYTSQIARGYQQALLEYPDAANLLFGCKPLECSTIVQRMVRSGAKHHCVITMPSYVQGLLDHMKSNHIDVYNDLTMIVIGQREPWWHYDEEFLLCDINAEIFASAAVRQMTAAIEAKTPPQGKNFKLKIEKTGDVKKPFEFSWV